MPLPNKEKGQTDEEFLDACLSSEIVNKEFPNTKQRFAVCQSLLRQSKKKAKGSEPKWKDQIINDTLVIL